MSVDELGQAAAEPPPSMDPLASVAMPPPRHAAPIPSIDKLYPKVRRERRRFVRRVAKRFVTLAVIGGAAYGGYALYSSRTADAAPAALQDYVDGDGVMFTPPFETISLRLPTEAKLGRDQAARAQRWNAHAGVGLRYAVDVISLDPALLRGVSSAPDGLDEVTLGVVAADLGAVITDVDSVTVAGRTLLEAAARTDRSSMRLAVVVEGPSVLAIVVTSSEGAGAVLRAAEESLHFTKAHP